MLTRWDPFDEMDRLTGRFFGERDRRMQRELSPAVDVFENDDQIELRVELPGMKPEDIQIDLSDDVLTLCGERKLEHDEEREGYRRIERSYGRVSRSFTLPKNVDQKNIAAEMKEGVLHLTLPKREEQQARRIQIGSGEGAVRSVGVEKGEKKGVEAKKGEQRRAEA